MDDVRLKLKQLPYPNYTVTLSGGEVGTMKRQDIEEIINTIKDLGNTLTLNTNGLFIKRYPDLLGHFGTVLYHCSENLDLTDELILDSRVDYMLVVTDNNYHKLGEFLNKYSDIKFNLIPASNPAGIFGPTLSSTLKHRMLKEYHTRMTKDSIQRIFNEKDFDKITYI
jgi:organic radical activating enzyme